jgi:hypothetical protein
MEIPSRVLEVVFYFTPDGELNRSVGSCRISRLSRANASGIASGTDVKLLGLTAGAV